MSFAAAASLWTLDPGVVFLNHGSFGATPRVVMDEQEHWRRRMERQPVAFHLNDIENLEREAMGHLARFVGAPADDMVWVVNATEGTNVVIRSFPLKPGDEILTTDHEYPAVAKTMRYFAERAGAKVVEAPIPYPFANAADLIEPIFARLTPRTRLIVVSHVTSMTATVFPAAEICRRARESGVAVLVDGAHAPAMLPLDVAAMGADFYTGNCHKWLCAPKGAGFLYVHPRFQDAMVPSFISHGWASDRTDRSPFQVRFSIQGTRDTSACLSVPRAIEFVRGLGLPAMRTWGHHLAALFRRELAARTGLAAPTPDGFEFFPMMATMPVTPGSMLALKAALYERHRVEMPVIDWRGSRWVRASGMPYNTEEQIVRAAEAVAEEVSEL